MKTELTADITDTYLAGVFSLEDGLALIAARGRMMQQLPGGSMLAVRLSEADLKPHLDSRISLAAINAPSLCVVSGPMEALEGLENELSQRHVPFSPLRTSHAFHSAMMDPILKPFAGLAGSMKLKAPQIPFISSVTGAWVEPVQAADPYYWAEHIRRPVRFADGIAALCIDETRLLLEVGPGRSLSNLAKLHPARNTNSTSAFSLRDLARWLANGDIEYLGRTDDQVKIRGHRIEPGEIESALVQHPAVRECVVLAREDLPGDKRLAAYVVGDPDKAGASVGELRDFLKMKLPDYMIPAAVVFLEALPVTPNGKLDRKLLPPPQQALPDREASSTLPGTPTETALAEIWREVLRLERVGIHDDFFDLGGHSLLMTQIISRSREAFLVELPIRRFFESPTIAGLSSVVEELLADEIRDLSEEEVRRLAHSAH